VDVVYLDHSATTPVRPVAAEAMRPWLGERYGNPSGAHAAARAARAAVEDAREIVAEALGCRPGEVIFTGGGTEADNLAVQGVTGARGGLPVCPATEHHAVLHPVEHLGGRVVGVHPTGAVDMDALADALDDDVALVSVMLANNESGVVQRLAEVASLVWERAPHAALHTDAVQAVSWLDVASLATDADLVSIAAHKFGGPQGVGALVVREGIEVEPLLLGGGQERERRSGTQNVAGIVGMAAALAETVARRADTVARIGPLRDRLVDGLIERVPGCAETGVRADKTAGTAHLVFDGIESESLLLLIEREGVLASAAASCASGAMDPSHVLSAMGYSRQSAAGSLRLTLGWTTTEADVDAALAVVPPAVASLRRPRQAVAG
jgi:cysteine desulfurase